MNDVKEFQMTSVWFIGDAQRRLILASDWARNGISSDDTSWDVTNGWSRPTTMFNQAQLDLLSAQGKFMLNAPDGPRDPNVINPPQEPGEGSSGYLHIQSSPASNWVIHHNLGVKTEPTIVLDSDPLHPVWTDVEFTSEDTMTLLFPDGPVAGRARIPK